MPFERFVQTGRIAKCSNGPLKNRLVSIVDVIDQTRVLVDGPLTGVPRQQYRLENLHLTKFRIKFPFNAPTSVVRSQWKAAKISSEWKHSAWATKAKNIRKKCQLNDFDRYKLRQAKRNKNLLLSAAYKQLKNRANRDGSLYGPKSVVAFKVNDKKKRRTPKADKAAKKPAAKK